MKKFSNLFLARNLRYVLPFMLALAGLNADAQSTLQEYIALAKTNRPLINDNRNQIVANQPLFSLKRAGLLVRQFPVSVQTNANNIKLTAHERGKPITESSLLPGMSCLIIILAIYMVWLYLSVEKRKRFTAERIDYLQNRTIRLHVISETVRVNKGQGVHTAFLESVQLLSAESNVIIHVNGEGSGNIFHSHTYGPYYFWKGRNYKGRRILTAHVIPESSKGSIPFWKILMPLTTWYLKLAYSYADVVIAISPEVEKTIRALGVKSKIVRINNPVLTSNWKRTPAKRKAGRDRLKLADAEKLVIGVGQLQQRKGVEDFIDVASAMPEARFAWIGGRPWGAFTEGVSRINKGIENAPGNLFFTGLLDIAEMPEIYAAADLFLFPSYQENCPLAPLEAAAAGLPVVFRDLGEYRSLYSKLYLKAASTREFIKLTKDLLNNKSHYDDATEISGKLLKDFDEEKVKQDLMSLYHALSCKYYKLNNAYQPLRQNLQTNDGS